MILTKSQVLNVLNKMELHLDSEGILGRKIGRNEVDFVRQWITDNSRNWRMAAFDHSECGQDCEIMNPQCWTKFLDEEDRACAPDTTGDKET